MLNASSYRRFNYILNQNVQHSILLPHILVYITTKEGKSNLSAKEDGPIKGKKVVVKTEKMMVSLFHSNRACN